MESLEAPDRQDITHVESLKVCQFEFVLRSDTSLHQHLHLGIVVQLRLYPVISCKPQTIIAENSWFAERVVNSLESLVVCVSAKNEIDQGCTTFHESSDARIQSTST